MAYTDLYGRAGAGLAGDSTAEQAASYLAGKVHEFTGLGPHIVDLEHRAAVASGAARAAGDLVRADQLKALIPKLADVHGEWLKAIDRWNEIRAAIPGLGAYWIIPVAWAAAIIAVAAAVVIIFAKTSTLDHAISALESGALPPADFRAALDSLDQKATATPSIFDGLNRVTKTAVVGLGIFAVYRLMLAGRGGPARW